MYYCFKLEPELLRNHMDNKGDINLKNLNVIFHIPWKLITSAPSGSQIRPLRMLEAFKSLGCKVDVIMGSGAERLRQINLIKQNVKKGKKYDFVYSESSSYPTSLAYGVKDAVKYPFLDFRFFVFCKKNNIPIGLFYRDIYWRFPELLDRPFAKKLVLNIMYRFDLVVYQKYLDVLYLPSEKMAKYLAFDFPVIKSLPPGAFMYPSSRHVTNNKNNFIFNVLYVGGIGNLYDLRKLVKVIGEIPIISLTICCRENEWQNSLNDYENLLKPNINIVHLSGDDLFSLYEKADVASMFFENVEYRDFAMPIKLFEYISHCKPLIVTKGTAAGDFVEINGIGWAIPYDEKSLLILLNKLLNDRNELEEKRNKIIEILPLHTWESRALQVCQDLTY